MAGPLEHWNRVYRERDEEELTWFEAVPAPSLGLLRQHLEKGEPFIDVGGGASRLVDALLDEGFGPLAVLDLSAEALARSRARLGSRAADVDWIEADITRWTPARSHALWHDRAVFHFLTDERDRARYARTLAKALRPGGVALIATFAEDGPERCSGLPVVRYGPEALHAEIERHAPGRFALLHSLRHVHLTPKGTSQNFQYAVLERL